VWRVSDDDNQDLSDNAKSILQAAGVPLDGNFATPHFTDPNAASPETRSISRTGVDPLAPLPPEQPPATPPKPRLTGVAVTPRTLRSGRAKQTVVNASVAVAGAPADVTLLLERRAGRKFKRVRRYRAQRLDVGKSLVSLPTRRLKPGSYRVSATGAGATKRATFSVR
jgi:hypothetical protein